VLPGDILLFQDRWLFASAKRSPPRQLRQLGDIGRYPPRLIFGEQLRSRSPARFILVIDIRKLLPAAVLHNKTGIDVFN